MLEEISIKLSSGEVFKSAPITDDAKRVVTLHGDNHLQLNWKSVDRFILPAKSTVGYLNDTFTLVEDYCPTSEDGYYLYDPKFVHITELFKRDVFFYHVSAAGEEWQEVDFQINANLDTIGKVIEKSIQMAGYPITIAKQYTSDLKALSFSGVSIWDALTYIATTFETEWWIKDGKLYFEKCETQRSIVDLSDKYVQVGNEWVSRGLKKISMGSYNESIPQYLYVYGSERNITKKSVAQDGMNLSYAKRLQLNKTIYPDGRVTIPNVHSGISKVQIFEDVYPKQEFLIESVRATGTTDFPIYYIKADIPFDPKDLLIEGCTMMVTFTSGFLNGREFEVSYKSGTKEIEIINQTENDQQIPFGAFIPKVDDKFVLWNILMGKDAIVRAQEELAVQALKYAEDLIKEVPETRCDSDEVYFSNIGLSLDLGDRVRIVSEEIRGSEYLSRIIKYEYNLTSPYAISFTLCSSLQQGRLNNIESTISDVTNGVDGANQIARSISRRAYRDAQELATMFDSLQKEFILVGVEANQFICSCAYSWTKESFKIEKGVIRHGSMLGETNGSWTIQEIEKTLPDGVGSIPYYVYIKCATKSNTTSVHLSDIAIPVDAVDGWYHFLLGVLNSEFEGQRNFNRSSGLTQIAGGTITTEQIKDAESNLIIDFSANPPRITARNGAVIQGELRLVSGEKISDELDRVDQGITAANAAAEAAHLAATEANDRVAQEEQDRIDAISSINSDISILQDQIDGVVENWFYDYAPTTSNFPTNTWTTDVEKSNHVGDTFTSVAEYPDSSAGKSWRWTFTDSQHTGYHWHPISDSDAVKALQEAAKAQSTADGKSTTYLTQPARYRLGDLWILKSDWNGNKKGDILTASTNRENFNASDWSKSIRYTDDTKAQLAEESAKTANALLSDIANDNKLTADEKSSTKKEWDVIVSEKPKNEAQAGLYGVPTTNYTAQYNALNGYITPLLSDLATTSDISGSEFRGKFQDYYEARQDLLGVISLAAKNYVEGRTAYVLNLSSDNVSIPCDQMGKPLVEMPTTYVSLYMGTTLVTEGVTWEKVIDGMTITSGPSMYTVTSLTKELATLKITANIEGGIVATATFTVSKVLAGVDGQTPIIMELMPEHAAINRSGELFTPSTTSCNAKLIVGAECELIGIDVPIEYKGRNLFLKSKERGGINNSTAWYFEKYDDKPFPFTFEKLLGKTVSISFDYDVSGLTTGDVVVQLFALYADGSTLNHLIRLSSDGKGRASQSYQIANKQLKPLADRNGYLAIAGNTNADARISITNVKVEFDTPTPYSPAPEDAVVTRNGAPYTIGSPYTLQAADSEIKWALSWNNQSDTERVPIIKDGRDGVDASADLAEAMLVGNLIRNGACYEGLKHWGGTSWNSESSTSEYISIFDGMLASGWILNTDRYINLEKSGRYVLSFKALSMEYNFNLQIYLEDSTILQTLIGSVYLIEREYKEVSIEFTVNAPLSNNLIMFHSQKSGFFAVTDVHLNYKEDIGFTPHKDDTPRSTVYLTESLKESTSVDGGLISSSLMILGSDSTERAGIDGTSSKVGMFLGGSYQQAVSDADKPIENKDREVSTLLKKNGDFQFSKGKIRGDGSSLYIGNAVITGDGDILLSKEGRATLITSDKIANRSTATENAYFTNKGGSYNVTKTEYGITNKRVTRQNLSLKSGLYDITFTMRAMSLFTTSTQLEYLVTNLNLNIYVERGDEYILIHSHYNADSTSNNNMIRLIDNINAKTSEHLQAGDIIVIEEEYSSHWEHRGTIEELIELYSEVSLLPQGISESFTTFTPVVYQQVIASDGYKLSVGAGNYFEIASYDNRLSLKATLPTSPEGLQEGEVYNHGGSLVVNEAMPAASILCGYMVNGNATIDKRYGVKAKSVVHASKNGTGRYIVPHNIGHSNYIANINPQWDTTAIASVVNTGANSVEIAIVNYNGIAIDCSFHITMIG